MSKAEDELFGLKSSRTGEYLHSKSADEMFDKLGYKKHETTWKEDGKNHFVEYNSNDTQIQFSLDTKHIMITNIINLQELEAINEKVKELRLGRRRR